MRRVLHWLLVASFIGIIAAPPVANLFGADGADPEAENRRLAAFPTRHGRGPASTAFLPGSTPGFPITSPSARIWCGGTASAAISGSAFPPRRQWRVGPRGWLFYADDGGLEDFTNEHPLTETEIQNWRTAIVRAKKWCTAQGHCLRVHDLSGQGLIYPELFRKPRVASTGCRAPIRSSRRSPIPAPPSTCGQALLDEKRQGARLPEDRHALESERGVHRLPHGHRCAPPATAVDSAAEADVGFPAGDPPHPGHGPRRDDGTDAGARRGGSAAGAEPATPVRRHRTEREHRRGR